MYVAVKGGEKAIDAVVVGFDANGIIIARRTVQMNLQAGKHPNELFFADGAHAESQLFRVNRSEMLQIYYSCEEKGEIRQYQLENFHRMYRAYKLLFGNSFIDEIRGKVITWRVIT